MHNKHYKKKRHKCFISSITQFYLAPQKHLHVIREIQQCQRMVRLVSMKLEKSLKKLKVYVNLL